MTKTNYSLWQPDIREVYEPDICHLRNVYQTMTARKSFICDQCHDVINRGELYDARAVQGAGAGGYINPIRLHCACRKAYIDRRNERYSEQHGLILLICMCCDKYTGYIDGEGNTGLSHGPCPDCEEAWIKEQKC